MIEIPDKDERDAFLRAAVGLERHVWLVRGRHAGRRAAIQRDIGPSDRTTAVHYLKFPLPARLADALRSAVAGAATITHLEMAIDHPAYSARVGLPAQTTLKLCEDLEP